MSPGGAGGGAAGLAARPGGDVLGRRRGARTKHDDGAPTRNPGDAPS